MSPWRAKWVRRLNNSVYLGVLALTNVLYSMVLIFVQQYTTEGLRELRSIVLSAYVLNFIYIVDLIANLVVIGPKSIWIGKKYLVLELLIQIGAMVRLCVFIRAK